MTSLDDMETEVKSQIVVRNKCYYVLGPILKRSISQSWGSVVVKALRY